MLFDIIHPEGAEPIAFYTEEFYAGTPAICRNNYGKGQAWYFGSRVESSFLYRFIDLVCKEYNIEPVFPTHEGIEATRRIKDGKEIIFVLNHNKEDTEIVIPFACRDLLTDRDFTAGERYVLAVAGVMVLGKL